MHHLNSSKTDRVIEENLTKSNRSLLKSAQQKLGKSFVKTDQGTIVAQDSISRKKTIIKSVAQLNEMNVVNRHINHASTSKNVVNVPVV